MPATECKVMSLLTHPEVTADSSPAVYFAQITAYKTHLPYSTLVQFLFTLSRIYLYSVSFIRSLHCSKLSYFEF